MENNDKQAETSKAREELLGLGINPDQIQTQLPPGMKTFSCAADAIFERRSVRKYKEAAIMNPLEVALINELIEGFKPTLGNAHVEACLLTKSDFALHFKVSDSTPNAPFYLVFMADGDPYAGFEAGRLGERIALNLCAVGTGTCFLDTPTLKGTSLPLPYAFTLAFGEANKSNTRPREKAERKQYEALVYNNAGRWMTGLSDSHLRVMDAGRFAPSVNNRQLWRFVPERNAIHLWEKKPSLSERYKCGIREGVEMGIVAENMSLRATQLDAVENAGTVFKTDDFETTLKDAKYWASVIT